MDADVIIERMEQRMRAMSAIILRAQLCPYCGSDRESHEYTGAATGGSTTTERGQLVEGAEHEIRCLECGGSWWVT